MNLSHGSVSETCYPNTSATTANSNNQLNPPSEKCCCGLIHLQTATILIAVLELLFFIYQVFFL